MLFTPPDQKKLYDALVARDASYEGRAYVGVISTGIFCRLTCPARKPKPENCRFFASVAECMADGFRPCKRCHPLQPAAEAEPSVKQLLDALEADPERRWSEDDIVRMGLDLSTVRRSFRRHFGMTFLEMARQERLRYGFQALADGGRVIDAQIDAGFGSPEAFRSAFARIVGLPPSKLLKGGLLRADWFKTPLGTMIAICDAKSLHLLEFVDRKALPGELKKLYAACHGDLGTGRFDTHDLVERQLNAFFEGRLPAFDLPLVLHGSAFTQDVWRELLNIRAGETRSYSEIARALDKPLAVRAVARANGANQIGIIIPCHRVIGADGSLTGYGGGLWRKQKLIEIEAQYRI
ncbi:AraC family transcriptional regulator of adaptative response/methylated-DNA-[protein]-cysteine methyltransferase [Ochrobactrum daejeonense]|uniref:methylated-DNA--[protein]-cysteine S-methyltransferase n=1 Tax=Brucella daejeonensis TaxID=659015 RepID=A0A7W9AUV2_9HYPH|nr:trifunctional transcriptional activator/DNA repair protein Ada/methylated-DNA--[protein]-cysteine S-methyltransferase [Brucella daejeonensis]MBB5701003.1 AraC family transcriptional regulator of adaptative response/methylated-DNA-[protein]-cysteine methyltransferase [Brucella daejeonensis]